jgi:hypothetical protein
MTSREGAMTLRQKTIIRVTIASLLMAGLIYREFQRGYSLHTVALLSGITLLVCAIVNVMPKRFTFTGRYMPNLEEQLTPIWGYGPPKHWRPFIAGLFFLSGIALVIWAIFNP